MREALAASLDEEGDVAEPEIKRGPLDLAPEVERYIRERAARLDSFHSRIMACRVVLDGPVDHHGKGGPFEVHLDLTLPGGPIAITRQRDENLRVAIRQAFDAAQRRLQDAVRIQRGQIKLATEPGTTGRVARLFPAGYGFIEADDGHEVYFHRNSVLSGAFDRLAVGAPVWFTEEPGDEGPQATTVRPEE